MATPTAAEWAVVREEELLLERAREAIARARPSKRRDGADELRALREEALQAAEDDMPAVLHELAVRQRLDAIPDAQALPSEDAPYFAHLRLKSARGVRDYLLGHRSLIDTERDVRIVDWRTAPIARVFHVAREADDIEEEIDGRTFEGTVLARRIVVIEKGALTQIVTADRVLVREGDGWIARERHASVGARTAIEVTALLDAAQTEATEVPPEQPLLVTGSAGSGKTTVALHRLARITAREPRRYPVRAARVVVPEEALARLSRRLLQPLADEPATVETLDAFALRLGRLVFGKLPKLSDEAPGLVVRLKRHPALYRELLARFASKRSKDATLRALRRRLHVLFTDPAFLGEVVAEAGDLPRSAIAETVRHTRLQMAPDVRAQVEAITVAELREAVDGRAIEDGTPDALAGTIDVEDLPILLLLRALEGALGPRDVAHLVVDEAEDVSLFELHALGALLREPRSVTVAGDELQRTTSGFAAWEESLRVLGVADAVTCTLEVSYRCPRPIVELAASILDARHDARAARDGAPVERVWFPDRAHADLYVADAARDLAAQEPRASIAVLARDEGSARRLHEVIGGDARLSLHGELPFAPGIDVLDVDGSKGLEFDYVFLGDVSAVTYPAEPESRRRLHVGVTRAAHQLWIVSNGSPSPILAGPGSRA